MNQSILFVGGQDLDGAVRRRLQDKRFAVSVVNDPDSAVGMLTKSGVNLVIVDLKATKDAARFIERIRRMPGRATIPLLAVGEWGTGQPTVALSAGADAYEPAPINSERLVDAVERILNKRAAVVGMND